MKINSYSKINISLLVKKKKKNLHKIKSFFILNENLYDEIEIEKSDKMTVEYYLDGKKILIKDCIITKTINYINKKFNVSLSYKIKVNKKIPIGSGLGGASSNAAILLNYIFENENIKPKRIKSWIKDIGSDVYFFYKKVKFAYVYSYGNKLIKLKKPAINFDVILNSDIICSTKKVYDEFDKCKRKRRNAFLQFVYIKLKCYTKLVNDLQEPCFNIYKNLEEKFNQISKNKNVILSGSGSSFIILKGE